MRYFKILIILLCVSVVVGCNSNRIEKPKKPKNLIKKQDELIKISNDLIKKLDEEKELNLQIAELNSILDNM